MTRHFCSIASNENFACPFPVLAMESDVVARTSFYEGKTVKIIVGHPAGTTHDTWARLSAQYMNKYIPGNPNFIVQSMTGAGSMVAAKYIVWDRQTGRPDLNRNFQCGALFRAADRPQSSVRLVQIYLGRQLQPGNSSVSYPGRQSLFDDSGLRKLPSPEVWNFGARVLYSPKLLRKLSG
jgi:hypothetical protein